MFVTFQMNSIIHLHYRMIIFPSICINWKIPGCFTTSYRWCPPCVDNNIVYLAWWFSQFYVLERSIGVVSLWLILGTTHLNDIIFIISRRRSQNHVLDVYPSVQHIPVRFLIDGYWNHPLLWHSLVHVILTSMILTDYMSHLHLLSYAVELQWWQYYMFGHVAVSI